MVKCGVCAWVEDLLKIIQVALMKKHPFTSPEWLATDVHDFFSLYHACHIFIYLKQCRHTVYHKIMSITNTFSIIVKFEMSVYKILQL